MKLLVIGDPHFKDDNSEETDLLSSEIDRIVEEEGVDEIVVLGDVNDRYKLGAQNRSVPWLIHLSTLRPTTVLIGNHERPDNTDYHGKIHHFVGIERENLRIIAESVRVGDILYVPYVDNGRFADSVKHAGGVKGVRFIFAHQAFIGCGEPNAKDEWLSDTRIISGHIHYNMVLYRGARSSLDGDWNVYYPGAPLCLNFGDSPDRVLCVVDGDEVRELPIKSHPRRTITFDADFDDDVIAELEKADKYTRVEVVGNYEDTIALGKSRFIREARSRGAQITTRRDTVTLPSTNMIERSNESFSVRLMKKMEEDGRWTRDELDELSKLLE